MPPLKDRSKNPTQDRILAAAVQLFSRQGFTGSSTHEIARLAGVSEVTVFRHFPRKRDLFWAATESRLRRIRISRELRIRLESDENPRSALPGIIELLVEIVYQHPETIRLLYLSLFELENGAERILRKHLVPLFQPLREYLCRCVSKGLIRDLDPSLAALSLAALVAAHQGLQSLLIGDQGSTANMDDAIATYTSFWMTAMLPEFALSEGERSVIQTISPAAD
ncbi:MAG TPA: TetR/AcrR family transcriptional regulator [Terriglobales bacterium]|jgi:AcrR family transcriptional regulator|nr:TetR/AcrR family transcriptional regulator [Terriglobales bacterium]